MIFDYWRARFDEGAMRRVVRKANGFRQAVLNRRWLRTPVPVFESDLKTALARATGTLYDSIKVISICEIFEVLNFADPTGTTATIKRMIDTGLKSALTEDRFIKPSAMADQAFIKRLSLRNRAVWPEVQELDGAIKATLSAMLDPSPLADSFLRPLFEANVDNLLFNHGLCEFLHDSESSSRYLELIGQLHQGLPAGPHVQITGGFLWVST